MENEIMSDSILRTIGNTPLVEIKKLNPNAHVKILAKLEFFNPGGSVKDRPALFMIEAGEKSGELTPDKTIVEATSGNTGIGLAFVCAVKGYKLLLTMSEAVSIERRKILKAMGAEILLTPGHMGTDGAIEEAYRLAREHPDQYFITDQFNNTANWQAHYHGTAVEIWEQTGGRIDTFIATMGTSGTLMGVSRRLKEYSENIEIVGVEPYLGHKIQGLKNMKEAYQPEIFEKRRLDQKVNIDDEEAFEMTRQLAKQEGIFVGMSSGAAMAFAVKKAQTMNEGTIVVLFPDSGERYLSTSLFAVQDKLDLKIFNTVKREKEIFKPIRPGAVTIYSCGPTAHANIHIGEMRRWIFSDLMCRYFEYRGYAVKHIMNITDLDDKTLIESEKAGVDLAKFTEGHIAGFKKEMKLLGMRPADEYPTTTENLEEMAELTEKLVSKGFAYEKLRSLYFDISRFTDYGQLSGIDINKIKLGATVDLEEYEKDNPRDFTLLKRSRLSELKRGIFLKTKWGSVRPSWHLQCAAISMKHMGENYDIHTGGRELIFPHHENQVAIATAITGKSPARYWVHSDRVLYDGKKVDDSDGRYTLDDLLEMGYSAREIRYWLLSGHYRKPLTFSKDRLEYAKRSLRRLDACISALHQLQEGKPFPEINQLTYDLKQGFKNAMNDDFNISAALASIFKVVKKVNVLVRELAIDPDGAQQLLAVFGRINEVLNVFDLTGAIEDRWIKALIEEREKARKEKNWELADQIRDQLETQGVTVRDGKISNH
jgi:cysteinyl-tRNA synthetase